MNNETKHGCGKEYEYINEKIRCGQYQDFICPDCQKKNKNLQEIERRQRWKKRTK